MMLDQVVSTPPAAPSTQQSPFRCLPTSPLPSPSPRAFVCSLKQAALKMLQHRSAGGLYCQSSRCDTCGSTNRSERRTLWSWQGAIRSHPDPSVEPASEAGGLTSETHLRCSTLDSPGVVVSRDASESVTREMVSHDARRGCCGAMGTSPARCCSCSYRLSGMASVVTAALTEHRESSRTASSQMQMGANASMHEQE
jgi:hypothetical protein